MRAVGKIPPAAASAAAVAFLGDHSGTLATHIEARHISSIKTRAGHYTSVARTLPNMRRLARLGYDAPSPILTEYHWPYRFKPFEHQKTTAAFLTLHERAFCFNGLGTGKTASVIWAADYLRRKGYANRVLILCPKSCVRSVWQRELFQIVPGDEVAFATGTKEQRLKALASSAPYIVANHDAVRVIANEIARDTSISLIVVDEATVAKNHKTKMFKALQYATNSKGLWLLTGTPCSQGPLDAYGLGRLVCPHLLPASFSLFQSMMCTPIAIGPGINKWRPRPGSMEKVFEYLHPAIRIAKEDCLDLPPVTYVDREVPLSAEQSRVAKELVTEWMAEDEKTGTVITAANAAVRLAKLLQVHSGSVIGENGTVRNLDYADRFAVLLELIEESEGKVFVLANYTATVDRLVSDLKKHTSVVKIDGRDTEVSRAQIVREFQSPGGPRVLVAHPRTTSHGLTLTAASTIIWFGPQFSAETYVQACNRCDRPGQTKKVLVYHLTSGGVETGAYAAVRSNLLGQAALLDLYRQATQRSMGATR